MILNAAKSNFVIFHRDKKKVVQGECQLVIDGNLIDRKCEATFLGAILEESLKFKQHVFFVVGKLTECVPLIYKLNYYPSKNNLRTTYYCLIHSNMMYCLSTWGESRLNALHPFEMLQNG